jgi:hypothetical protein
MPSALLRTVAATAIALVLSLMSAGFATADDAPGSQPPAPTTSQHAAPPGVFDPNCYLQSGELTRSAGESIGHSVGTMIGNTIFFGHPGGRAFGYALGDGIGQVVGFIVGVSFAGIIACPNHP